ncbi:MAG: hypothetical protein HFJ45_08550 [Clostridia bacterium]|nr:hypothetical protein [Clostridia bacterium]
MNNLYLTFLIILLIISFIISFKTGEGIYYLFNTNLDDKISNTNSEIAIWEFKVRIEY